MNTASTLHPQLNVAIKAARAAGAIINRAALDLEAVRISRKQFGDFVTEVDHAAEQEIITLIGKAYPNHSFWAEESGKHYTHKKRADHVWIIDPLDGTTNFIHNFPFYSISIALQYKGKIEQAVIYDPTRNDLFCATKGRGAFFNNKRIRVSKRSRLSDSLIVSGLPFSASKISDQDSNDYMALLSDLLPRVSAMRRTGSAALDLAYVAAGFSDGFLEKGLQPWDVAAGGLLVTEAGGLMGNFSGESEYLKTGECLAANPKMYANLVPLLKKYSSC
jgi:myo-inositol-1(or 4)-monophosphatase